RILERLPFDLPLALPADHLVAGNLEARQRLADERRDDAEILRDDARAGGAEHVVHALPLQHLLFLDRRDEGGAAVGLADVGAEEADEMIDAVAVIEVGAAPRARRQPAEPAGGDHLPAIRGEAPVLAGL